MLSLYVVIFEKLIKALFIIFFEKHNVLYAYQYDFRKNCSVTHALLDVITNAFNEIQSKKYTTLLLTDICKVFDTVSHEILLHKLQHYGIRGPALSLIENHLLSRSQFVPVNNCNSSSKPITIVVPQGSMFDTRSSTLFDLRERPTQCYIE